MLITLLFIKDKMQKPKCPLTDEQIDKTGASIQWNVIQQGKGLNMIHDYNMDELESVLLSEKTASRKRTHIM